jgi:SAM-dependent methyltransferase
MGTIRRVVGWLASRTESLLLPAGALIPPLHLRWRYYGTARRCRYLRFATELAHELLSRGLQPDHRVLDVGCGIGPLAVGLIPHLTRGSYEGFDVHADAVAWCRRTISARHPHFGFRHADLSNTTYNPRGTLRASTYRFPYGDEEFDFAYLGSVCTHLLPDEASHYLLELGRVLKPGGTCVVSFYLQNEESLAGIAAGTSFLPFAHPYGAGNSRVIDQHNPEAAIAHAEDEVRSWYADAGLRIEEPIRRGHWWSGVAHDQDVITAVKPDR